MTRQEFDALMCLQRELTQLYDQTVRVRSLAFDRVPSVHAAMVAFEDSLARTHLSTVEQSVGNVICNHPEWLSEESE